MPCHLNFLLKEYGPSRFFFPQTLVSFVYGVMTVGLSGVFFKLIGIYFIDEHSHQEWQYES